MRAGFWLCWMVLAVAGARTAMAAPCQNVVGSVSADERMAMASSLVRELNAGAPPQAPKVDKVDVKGMFRNGDWTIVQASPGALAEVFLFFKGDPAVTRYVTEWGGTGAVADRAAGDKAKVAQWVTDHAPGIPGPLANCFVDSVAAGQ